MSEETPNKERAPQRPVEMRDGPVKASIFRNDGEHGPMFNTTFSRTYTDRDGNKKESRSFQSGDILRIQNLSGKVHDRINEMRREAYEDLARDETRQDRHKGRTRRRDDRSR